jgi:hypothetical protein
MHLFCFAARGYNKAILFVSLFGTLLVLRLCDKFGGGYFGRQTRSGSAGLV